MPRIKLAIVGKRETIREGIVKLLTVGPSFEVVSVATAGEEAIKQCRKAQPDVILICAALSEWGGIKSIQYIHEKLPNARLIVGSDEGAADELIGAVAAGVSAYLSPDISINNLISTINLVAEGNLVLSPHMSEKVVANIESLCRHEGVMHLEEITVLTKKEKAVLGLVKEGLTNKEIATALCISEHTVKVHVQNIMGKLDAHTRQQAVRFFNQGDLLHRIQIN